MALAAPPRAALWAGARGAPAATAAAWRAPPWARLAAGGGAWARAGLCRGSAAAAALAGRWVPAAAAAAAATAGAAARRRRPAPAGRRAERHRPACVAMRSRRGHDGSGPWSAPVSPRGKGGVWTKQKDPAWTRPRKFKYSLDQIRAHRLKHSMKRLRVTKDEEEVQRAFAKVGKQEQEQFLSIQQRQEMEMRQLQLKQINNFMSKRQKKYKSRAAGPATTFEFSDEKPDFWYEDRVMLCRDCERRERIKGLPPQPRCSGTTLLELDFTAPWSRDNTVSISCWTAQMIRQDKWCMRDPVSGKMKWVDGRDSVPGAFPFQVCKVCKATSADKGHAFIVCPHCEGVCYCSTECQGKDWMLHKATCTKPYYPHRSEFGVRGPLRGMVKDLLSEHAPFVAKLPGLHRIPWLPAPKRKNRELFDHPDAIKPKLPGFANQELLPAEMPKTSEERGISALLKREDTLHMRRVRGRSTKREPFGKTLGMLGLNRKEWRAKNAAISQQIEAEEEDMRRRGLAVTASAHLALKKPPAPKPRFWRQRTARDEAAGLRLSAAAAARLDDAARSASAERKAPWVPPRQWEDLQTEEERARYIGRYVVQEGGAAKGAASGAASGAAAGAAAGAAGGAAGDAALATSGPTAPPPEETGVVQTTPYAKQLQVLRLTPAAIARLEAVAALGDENKRRHGTFRPPVWTEDQGEDITLDMGPGSTMEYRFRPVQVTEGRKETLPQRAFPGAGR